VARRIAGSSTPWASARPVGRAIRRSRQLARILPRTRSPEGAHIHRARLASACAATTAALLALPLIAPLTPARTPRVVDAAAGPVFTATLHSAVLYGLGAPDAYVTASLIDRCLGGRAAAWGDAVADARGAFSLTLRQDGSPLSLRPGWRVLVAGGSGRAAEVCLPDIAARADADADVVSGIAPPGAAVTVTLFAPDGRRSRVVTAADDAAVFRADLAGTAALGPGAQGLMTARLVGNAHVALRWAAPRMTIDVGEATLTGDGAAARDAGLTLARDGDTIATTWGLVTDTPGLPDRPGAWTWDVVLRDGAGVAVAPRPGDSLAAVIGDDRLSIVVPRLVAEVDAVADRVSGVAPPERPVTVTLQRAPTEVTRATRSTADGYFTVSVAGDWDITPGDTITAEVGLDAGVAARVRASDGVITLLLDRGEVDGFAPPGSAVVARLTVDNAGERATGRTTAGADGRFALALHDPSGASVRPDPGDRLQIERGPIVTEMMVTALTAVLDLADDRVGGRAGADGEVTVRALVPTPEGWRETQVVAPVAPGGTYNADFRGRLDVAADTRLEVSHRAADGNVTRIDRRVAMLHVQHLGNRVAGIVAPQAHVTAELWRGAGRLASRGAVARADGAFEMSAVDDAGQPVTIAAGDRITVTWAGGDVRAPDDAGSVAVVVEPVTATLDVSTAHLIGRAPPGRAVVAVLHDLDGSGADATLSIDPRDTGEFAVPVGGVPADGSLHAGGWADVGVRDADGRRTYVLAVAPFLDAVLGVARVTGRAAPLTSLVLALTAGGETLASASARSDTLGEFTVALVPTHADVPLMAPGQRLDLTEPDGRRTTLELPRLSVAVDPAEGSIHGEAPPGAVVVVEVIVPGRSVPTLTARAASDGTWRITQADLPAGTTVAEIIDADATVDVGNGHRVTARGTPTGHLTATPVVTASATDTPVSGSATPSPTPIGTPATPTPRIGATVHLPVVVRRAFPP
jgi:hypothetical protein